MSPPPAPRPRADAARNRERLLKAAATVFRGDAANVSLEAVAREAGVGIGTLYRHFPNWDALVAAVYRAELDELDASAAALLTNHTGADALTAWIDRYAGFVATKRGMLQALQAVRPDTGMPVGDTRSRVTAVIERLLAAGTADGTLRVGVRADDVTSTLIGVFLATPGAADADRRRMFDLVVAGLRSRP